MSTKAKITILIAALLLAGVAAASVFTYIQNNPPVPKFSYDESKLPDWWGSENINVQSVARSTREYTGEEPIEKLPIADLTVHHGKPGSDAPADNCFISFSYFDYTADDLQAKYDEYEARKSEHGVAKELEPLSKTVSTFEGNKEFELRRYDYTVEKQDVLSGYQIGFVPLTAGHVRVEGVCKTANDLDSMLPVLEAVTLREN